MHLQSSLSLQAQWLLYVPSALTLQTLFCQQCMCHVSKNLIISLNYIYQLVSVLEMLCFLYIIQQYLHVSHVEKVHKDCSFYNSPA
jgi:hypothetical protein